MVRRGKGAEPKIHSQKKIEEIAVAVIRDFQKSFFGSEADDPARFALPTPIDQFASDYLNLKVSFQKLSSDGSIYGLTAYVDTEYQIEVDGSQRSIFLKTNDVVLDKSFIEPANIRKLCVNLRFPQSFRIFSGSMKLLSRTTSLVFRKMLL